MALAALSVLLLLAAAVPSMAAGAAPAPGRAIDVPLMHINKVYAAGWAPYVDMLVGTPPQLVSLLVDTGSATLGIPVPQVTGPALPQCASQAQYAAGTCVVGLYDPEDSTTAVEQSGTVDCNTPVTLTGGATKYCGFAVTYGSGDAGMAGVLFTDTVRLGGLSGAVTVGAILQVQDGFQEPPSTGILGVAGDALNCNPATFASDGSQVTCRPDAVGQLLAQNGLPNILSFCVGTPTLPGVLTLGGVDEGRFAGALQYTPLVAGGQNGAFYQVNMVGLAVNRVNQGIDFADLQVAIVDSGTFYLQLSAAAYAKFSVRSAQPCSSDSDCVVQLYFANNVALDVPGLLTCASRECTVLTENDTPAIAQGDQTIIGYKVMQSQYTVFDRNNSRVGFAPVLTCYNECPRYLSRYACGLANCEWKDNACVLGVDRGREGVYLGLVTAAVVVFVVLAFVLHPRVSRWHAARQEAARAQRSNYANHRPF